MKIKPVITLALALVLSSCYAEKEDEEFRNDFYTAHESHSIKTALGLLDGCESQSCYAFGNRVIADLCFQNGQFDSAIVYGQRSLLQYKSLNRKKAIIKSYWFLGDVFENIGDYNYSIRFYNNALDQNPSKELAMSIKVDYARSLYQNGELLKASDVLKETLEYHKKEDKKLFAEANLLLGNIDAVYQSKQFQPNYNNSYDYFFTALRYFKRESNKAWALNCIGKNYCEEGKYEMAKVFLDSANRLQPDPITKPLISFNYGILFKEKGELEKAIVSMREFIYSADTYSTNISDGYNELIKLHIDLNDDITAKNLSDEHTSRVNSQFRRVNLMRNLTTEALYGAAKLKDQNNQLKKYKAVNKTITVTIIVLTLLSGVLLFRNVYPVLKENHEFKRKLDSARKKVNEIDL